MPNKQRKMPQNTFGLFTTTTRILSTASHHRRSHRPHRIKAMPSMMMTSLDGNRKQDSKPIPNDIKHSCIPYLPRLRRLTMPSSHATILCLLARYARKQNRCQSFEKYNIKRPSLKERQASSPTHSLLTHSGSKGVSV